MTLVLDTTDFHTATLALHGEHGEEIAEVSLPAGKQLTRQLVPHIVAMCHEHGVPFDQLTGIQINTGPGSFTGTRIGVAVGNALGYALGIPVNGKRSVTPHYGAPPNITL